jgi:hypothetical protein
MAMPGDEPARVQRPKATPFCLAAAEVVLSNVAGHAAALASSILASTRSCPGRAQRPCLSASPRPNLDMPWRPPYLSIAASWRRHNVVTMHAPRLACAFSNRRAGRPVLGLAVEPCCRLALAAIGAPPKHDPYCVCALHDRYRRVVLAAAKVSHL